MRIPKLYYILVLLAIVLVSLIQINGCRKLEAADDDQSAADNSLVYTPIHKFYLPAELDETSGLIYFNHGLYSHNDSDGGAVLYRFDTLTGAINQQISLTAGLNLDWEDLAQDENYVYVGDFGNNAGNRTNLKIYKFSKSLFPENGDISITPESIKFSYEDQEDFTEAFMNNDYDCEAMIAHGDNLYLFSKNWLNQKTRLYSLPKTAGTYQAQLISEFDANCLITGATINTEGTEIALIGYIKDSWIPVMWLLKDFNDAAFFSGEQLRFEFPSILSSQTEGIAFTEDDKLFISGERTNVSDQRVFRLLKSRVEAINNND